MGRSIPSLLQEFQLSHADLFKLDIEGAETEVFSAPTVDWIARTRALIIEIHGKQAEAAVGKVMKERGYNFHHQGDKFIFVRQAARAAGHTSGH